MWKWSRRCGWNPWQERHATPQATAQHLATLAWPQRAADTSARSPARERSNQFVHVRSTPVSLRCICCAVAQTQRYNYQTSVGYCVTHTRGYSPLKQTGAENRFMWKTSPFQHTKHCPDPDRIWSWVQQRNMLILFILCPYQKYVRIKMHFFLFSSTVYERTSSVLSNWSVPFSVFSGIQHPEELMAQTDWWV